MALTTLGMGQTGWRNTAIAATGLTAFGCIKALRAAKQCAPLREEYWECVRQCSRFENCRERCWREIPFGLCVENSGQSEWISAGLTMAVVAVSATIVYLCASGKRR